MKKSNNNIELVVFNFFIRAIKTDGKYMLFRRSVNNEGIMKALIKNSLRRSDNPFSSSSSTDEIISILERITNDMAKGNGKKGGIKDLDKYEHVTMTINHLLHFFMECNGVSMDKLCSLGEEIYSRSCNKLFGDTIEELEKKEEEEMKSLTDSDHVKAKLFKDFIEDIKNGKIRKDMSFDDYLSKHMISNQNIDASRPNDFGQVLGQIPDNNFIIENDENVSWENFI